MLPSFASVISWITCLYPPTLKSEVIVKNVSSFLMKASRPPINSIKPGGSCCTDHSHCQAFPSVYTPPQSSGSNGVTQEPSRLRPRMNPVDESYTLRYDFDCFMKRS